MELQKFLTYKGMVKSMQNLFLATIKSKNTINNLLGAIYVINRRYFIQKAPIMIGTSCCPILLTQCKKPIKDCQTRSGTTGYTKMFKEDIIYWLESIKYKTEGWGRWKYHRFMDRNYGLESSEMTIGILDLLGELKPNLRTLLKNKINSIDEE